jgi:alkyl hydroperoxide reductase subunit AhpC
MDCCDSLCCELQVGKPAPGFKGKAVVGDKIVDLSYDGGVVSLDGKAHTGKWVVFFFYPLDFTFVCPTEIIAFDQAKEKFDKLNACVIGASVDSQYAHLAWNQTPRNKGGLGGVRFPLFADLDRAASDAYNVLLDGGIAARGVFIIDDKGVLQSYTVNNLGVGRNVDEVLRTLEAYQYVATHGEVCPANWSAGKDTMKPDPVGSQAYFKKQ